jgi:hypothetical protein
MQIISNEPLIKRNARIGQITSITGLAVLVLGMILSFTISTAFIWSLLALIVGFTLSQIGIYYGNRWGRKPRPDEQLSAALKGLDHTYTLYHYTTPTSHLVVGPAGIFVLMPRQQRGNVVYQKGRWRSKGGGFFQAYLRFFAQEGLGRPDLEAPAEVHAVQKYLTGKLEGEEIPEIQAILVFTNENVNLEENPEATPQAITAKKLKEFIRKTAKGKTLSAAKAKTIQDALEL